MALIRELQSDFDNRQMVLPNQTKWKAITTISHPYVKAHSNTRKTRTTLSHSNISIFNRIEACFRPYFKFKTQTMSVHLFQNCTPCSLKQDTANFLNIASGLTLWCQLQATVLLIGTLLLFDPVLFPKYEAYNLQFVRNVHFFGSMKIESFEKKITIRFFVNGTVYLIVIKLHYSIPTLSINCKSTPLPHHEKSFSLHFVCYCDKNVARLSFSDPLKIVLWQRQYNVKMIEKSCCHSFW